MDVAAANGNEKSERPKEEVNGRSTVEPDIAQMINRVICVSLPSLSSKPIKTAAATPEEILPIVMKSNLSWVNYTANVLEEDGVKVAMMFGFGDTMIPTLLKGYYANYEDREVELGVMVPAVRVQGLDMSVFPVMMLVKKGLILTIHGPEVTRIIQFSRYADTYLRKLPDVMPQEDKLSMMLIRLLDENNTKNFEQLRNIEDQADSMSEKMIDPSSPRMEVGRSIYNMKHTLITYLNTLWRTLDVVNTLRYGDAEVITDNQKVLNRFGLLADELNRQIELSEHMSEVLASGLEVLQSLYNNQLQILNNRMSLTMTWLTILGTAVLVPNTLATIFGFVFNLEWQMVLWTMGIITVATVGSTLLAWWWVKKRIQLPKRADEMDRNPGDKR